ncbi:MAG: hypothetical protein K2L12_07670 [Clostridia bacterium]|nr:hypothetical protein [Clostridia bacterium]
MAQIELLLKYQTEDSKLLQIERDAAGSEEWKNYSQAKSFLTKAPEKLDAMDAKAQDIYARLDSLNKKYDEIAETLKDFENLDELVDGGADISFYKKNATQIIDQLKAIKGEINALVKSVKEADEEYQSLKKKTISVQKQYAEYSAKYQEYRKGKLAEMDAIKNELKVLAKDINPEVLRRYEMKRSERIFPIICTVKNNRCSKCGMELSIVGKEKISGGEVTECENCHRFLYKE